MNWEAIGAVGEIVGAAAVVMSLAYLAIQIRHNTRQLEEQDRSQRLTALIAAEANGARFRNALSHNPQSVSVWRRGLESSASLTLDERAQFDLLCTDYMWTWANLWGKVREGVFFEGHWGEVKADLENQLRHPGLGDWWRAEANRERYFSDFSDYVSSVVAGHAEEGRMPKPRFEPSRSSDTEMIE